MNRTSKSDRQEGKYPRIMLYSRKVAVVLITDEKEYIEKENKRKAGNFKYS